MPQVSASNTNLPQPTVPLNLSIHCVPSLWTLSLPCTPPSSQPMGTCGRLCPTCRGLQPRYGRQSPRYGRQSPRYGRLWVGRAAKSRPTVNLSSLITNAWEALVLGTRTRLTAYSLTRVLRVKTPLVFRLGTTQSVGNVSWHWPQA